MANQIIVTQSGNVQVSIEPPANVQVQISRAAIGTVSNVPTANFANYAGNVTVSAQPNITSLGTLTGLTVSGNSTVTNLNVTGNLSVGNLVANSANYANFAGVANTANTVAGANVTGVVANATFATSAGTANSATVANTANSVALANVSGAGNIASINLDGNVANLLTGLGTFVAIPTVSANANYANFANIANTANSVAVANVSGIGNIATVNLDGNASNILFGNGIFSAIPAVSNVANANYANFAGTAFSVSGSNVSGEVANAAYANAANTANLATYATTANSVAGANVSGTVANATFALDAGNSNLANTANSVAVANVSGIGNIATVNLDGNASNILYGNGVFATTPIISNVANANYANFAGTAFSVSGSNVSGEVANANFASYANIASSANSVALANVSGIGNIANINLDGSSSNVLFGNGVFAPESTSIANANYANFAGTAFSVSGSNVSGEVANAAYANIAGVANSVAGANVSGTVANANYSAFANVAASANSVAVANVSGIGNIATVNLDGSSSNVLFGNGIFAPESTSIANANYANFAGNALILANGTSNISIPSANGTIAFSVNNTANLMLLENGGFMNTFPTSSVVNMLRINTFNNSLSDAHRIAWARARGTNASPTSVQGSDRLGVLSFFGHNGTSYQTNSISFIRATVDSSYTANGTNIPIGLQLIVNDTNGGTNNQGKTHNFYANGNVNFANSVVVTNDLTVSTGNITATAGILNGNGSGLSQLTGANVTGQVPYANVANSVAVANVSGIGNIATINLDGNSSNVLFGNGVFAPESTTIANANYANFAGTVITNAQPNITSTGNLTSLNVVDSANVTGTIQQLAPNTITITTNANTNTAYNLTTLYGETSNIQESGQRAIIRSRGNVSSPSTTVVNDVGARDRVYFYNGTTNALGFATSLTLSNLNSNSNAFTTGANYSISVGNPNGDQGNANASSGLNLLQLNQNGQLILLPGANSTAGSMLNMFNYGQPASLSTAQGITMSRARGNRDANLSVQANDQIGRLVFQAHNGTSFVTNRLPIIRATVDSSYTANTANIPAGFQMLVNDNTTTYTHNFYANGNIAFSGRVSAGNLSVGDIISGNINAIGSVIEAGNSVRISLDNNQTQGILQSTYNNANIQTGSWTSWRQRGTKASPLGVQAGDEISKFSSVVYADSGNTYVDAVTQLATVVSNDGAGNVVSGFRTRAFGGANSFVSMQAGQIQFMDSSSLTANATIYANGYIDTISTVSAANVAVTSNGFMKLASYTEAALSAITGQIGWMAAVSDSASGGNPNGMIAFWDTTNSRWSYIHDNSAV